jgi:hypothetical protein
MHTSGPEEHSFVVPHTALSSSAVQSSVSVQDTVQMPHRQESSDPQSASSSQAMSQFVRVSVSSLLVPQ